MGACPPGSPQADAQGDFSRARRARLLADIGRRLRREPDDVALILPFEEVVEALGVVGREDLGLQIVPLDAIVGTVDRAADFDRGFRPTSPRLRSRWERIAAAQRRGESLPPISLYRVGDLYFVRDGHHRVSVAKSLGREDIDAYVVEIQTRVRLGRDMRVGDLPLKDHERLFRERVPLGREERARIGVATRGTSAGSPRRSRRGASARCRTAAPTWTAARSRTCGSLGVPAGRGDAQRGRADRPRRDRDRRLHADLRHALPRPAHARVERRGARGAAPPRGPRPAPPAAPAAATARGAARSRRRQAVERSSRRQFLARGALLAAGGGGRAPGRRPRAGAPRRRRPPSRCASCSTSGRAA